MLFSAALRLSGRLVMPDCTRSCDAKADWRTKAEEEDRVSERELLNSLNWLSVRPSRNPQGQSQSVKNLDRSLLSTQAPG
jgi:hypothetical protein